MDDGVFARGGHLGSLGAWVAGDRASICSGHPYSETKHRLSGGALPEAESETTQRIPVNRVRMVRGMLDHAGGRAIFVGAIAVVNKGESWSLGGISPPIILRSSLQTQTVY